jgi:diguanylate cyclase (GGDEF)-like protein
MAEAGAIRKSGTVRVLYVGAEKLLVRQHLEQGGVSHFEITCASGVRSAIAVLRRRPPDVVLADRGDPALAAALAAIVPRRPVVLLGDHAVAAEPLLACQHAGVHEQVPVHCLHSGCGFSAELLRRALHHACERGRIERQWAELALRDPLTGLPNRRALAAGLAAALARARRHGKRLGVLFIDVDRFKAINDRHGHAAGDQVLREIASRLRTCLRASDLVARLAGDEFVAVVEDLESMRAVDVVVGKIHGILARPIVLGTATVVTSVTIGVAVGPTRAHGHADAILAAADTAMYRSKRRKAAAAAQGARRHETIGQPCAGKPHARSERGSLEPGPRASIKEP